jgi:hypothetical protein
MKDLERRVANLETDVRAIRDSVSSVKTDVATLAAHAASYATKADLHQELNAQTWKIMGIIVTLVLGVFGLMRAFPPKVEVPPVQVQYLPQEAAPPSPAASRPAPEPIQPAKKK